MNAATSEAAAAGSKPLTLKELHSRDGADPGLRDSGRRALPRRRHPRLRPHLARPGGGGRRRLRGAARRRLPRHHPPRPRPLPGQGRGRRRHDGRAVRPRRRASAAARAARCTSPIPRAGSSAPTRSSAPACRSRSAPALSSKLLGQGRVAVAFFGEGAVNQGAFHEAVNLAAIWQLPVLFVCENNVYAEFSDSRRDDARAGRGRARAARLRRRGRRWSTATTSSAVHAAALAAAARCRDGAGPFLIEAETYRWHGHYEGDAQPYKPERGVRRLARARPARTGPRARLAEERRGHGRRARGRRAGRARARRAAPSSVPARPLLPRSRRPSQNVFGD